VALGQAWAQLNSLMVLAACRGCWDRPREEATPWLAPQLAGWLVDSRGKAVTLEVEAISETGCEVRLREGWSEAAPPLALRLGHPLLAEAPWAVELACRAAEDRGRGERLGLRWGPLSDGQREQLQTYLYRRPGLWPTRRAPWDPLALVMVAHRVLQRRQPERWFSRSLLPIR
jgi:cellulose synthase (UDP-forming)